MRLITLIFSIYVMALATWPCADVASADNQSTIEHSHDHENSEGHSDLCSPFCSCQCCQVNMQMPVAFLAVTLPQYSNENKSMYNGNIPESPGHSLFIPPRA